MTWTQVHQWRWGTQVEGASLPPYNLPIATPLLRVQAVPLDLQQADYRKIGYLSVLTLDNSQVLNRLIVSGNQTIEIPSWLQLFKVRFNPRVYLISADIRLFKLPPPLPNQEPDGITGLFSNENPPPNWINW